MSCENYDPYFPDQQVVDLYLPIWAGLPAFRARPAFIWAEDSRDCTTRASITYYELNSSVQAIASKLLQTLHRGDRLLILCNPGLQLIKILFACQRAGLVGVPIIPPDPSVFSTAKQSPGYHHLIRAISQARPTAAVADPCFISAVCNSIPSLPNLGLLSNLEWLSSDDLEVDHEYSKWTSACSSEYPGCRTEDVYLIQYTSGATGVPKPVLVTAGAAAHNVRAARKAYDLQPSSVIVSWLPQYHDCGFMFLLLTVVSGATCVLTSPSAFLRRPRLWLELATEFRSTCTPVPSFALPLVLKRGGVHRGKLPLELGSLRNLILINEPIYKSPVEEFLDEFGKVGLRPESISPSYGLAENCTFVSTAWQSQAENTSAPLLSIPTYHDLLPSARLGALSSQEGRDMEILVVNEETCELVEDGVEGEVWVSSPSNALGYLGHPSMTREAFHASLRGRLGPCFVRTGDRGIIKGEQRYLYIVGRVSDIIRTGGRQVHPHYLETAAYESNATHLRGGCISAFSAETPWRSTAVIVVAELQKRGEGGGAADLKSICKRIKEAISKKEGIEVGVVALVHGGSVPKTTSGKLRRWLARDELLGGRLPVVCQVKYEEGLCQRDLDGNKVGKIGEVETGLGGASGGGGAGVQAPMLWLRVARQRPSLLSFL